MEDKNKPFDSLYSLIKSNIQKVLLGKTGQITIILLVLLLSSFTSITTVGIMIRIIDKLIHLLP